MLALCFNILAALMAILLVGVLLLSLVGDALKTVPALLELSAASSYLVREVRRLATMLLVSLAARVTPAQDKGAKELLGHVGLYLARQGEPRWAEQRDAMRKSGSR